MPVNRASAFAAAVLAVFSACRTHSSNAPPADVVVTPRAPPFTRAAYPVIDVHTHFDPAATARQLAIMDAQNIRYAVNLSAGWAGQGLEEALAQQRATGGRIVPFCMIDWQGVGADGWVQSSVDILRACAAAGVPMVIT